MGLSLDKISSYRSKQLETRVLITGLDAAGKTTLLYVLKLGEVVDRSRTFRLLFDFAVNPDFEAFHMNERATSTALTGRH